jgi:aldose sugar dehydrogenase
MISRRRATACLGAGMATLAAPAVTRAQLDSMRSNAGNYRLTTIARGLDQPWSMAFLPDGTVLITERSGRLRRLVQGSLEAKPVEGTPAVYASGQGGLLDVVLHPGFATNQVVYLSQSAQVDGGALTRVVRARYVGGSLREVTPIFDALPAQASGSNHFGSRIAFDAGGLMYVTTGERYQMSRAQKLDDLGGKVVRLRDDGSVPPDNPFVGRSGARPEIFTFGHRNPQGLARHPTTGRMWLCEHGPRGGDEINLLKAGANYGWPLATHGVDYSGRKISDHTSLAGMENAVRWWVPSISPSGLCFYSGDRFPGWKGSLFTGALSSDALYRIHLDGDRYVSEERLAVGRLINVRDVRQGPDGLIYVLTRVDGALHRLEPA